MKLIYKILIALVLSLALGGILYVVPVKTVPGFNIKIVEHDAAGNVVSTNQYSTVKRYGYPLTFKTVSYPKESGASPVTVFISKSFKKDIAIYFVVILFLLLIFKRKTNKTI